jgi:hypothetical protein
MAHSASGGQANRRFGRPCPIAGASRLDRSDFGRAKNNAQMPLEREADDAAIFYLRGIERIN